MAKADDVSSTIYWIWLFDALQEATNVLGSQALAQGLLEEWLATGKLPFAKAPIFELVKSKLEGLPQPDPRCNAIPDYPQVFHPG